MTEEDPKTSAASSVPPIHDDSYTPPENAVKDPGTGAPIIEGPPFGGDDDEEK